MKLSSSSSSGCCFFKTAQISHVIAPFRGLNFNPLSPNQNSLAFLTLCNSNSISLTSHSNRQLRFAALCASRSAESSSSVAPQVSQRICSEEVGEDEVSQSRWNVEVGKPSIPNPSVAKLSFSDKAFFLLAFIACTTSVAFTSLVIAAVPTLYAMGRAATSLSKLADTAREELPSTMAAIRLSGMEISDLTLELSDLSQEITDGVNKSAQAVQAAEAGIRQIGTLARQQTICMFKLYQLVRWNKTNAVVMLYIKEDIPCCWQGNKDFHEYNLQRRVQLRE
ncbi:uncharacterized protein LOC107425935 isoform X2 [Ziziphus jujuba]|uniref:Uncharacterized protein LOC107425935 isoform X2 n=1 Tax=Ziziphus jujuba TaxID=326968 RepID=A0A6P6GH92_ZIZJJ|nr:uncharacterized protein LOC107425935 isoform X2 [Ziziphus jujuba]